MENNNLCDVHLKELILLCSHCNELVCVKCTTSSHRAHVFEDFDSIKQNNQFKNRLDELWKLLDSCNDVIKNSNTAEESIAQYYNKLHNLLMIEEQKAKKPVVDQKQVAESLMFSIIEELKSVGAITNYLNQADAAAGNIEDQINSINVVGCDDENDSDNMSKSIDNSEIIDKIYNSASINDVLPLIIGDNQRIIISEEDPNSLLLLRHIKEYNKKSKFQYKVPEKLAYQENWLKNITLIQDFTNGELKKTIKELIKKAVLQKDQDWYIICKQWYDKWNSDNYKDNQLGPIDNKKIVMKDTTHIKRDAKENVDFVAVPSSVWYYFQQNYGCSTIIQRKVVKIDSTNTFEIDYNPELRLKFYWVGKPTEVVQYCVRVTDLIATVKINICKQIGIDPARVDLFTMKTLLLGNMRVGDYNFKEDQLVALEISSNPFTNSGFVPLAMKH